MVRLELLAPAKNLEQGIAAIDHGADALYIGPPSFGARVAAGNRLQDIEQLVEYAHLFHSKIYVTVNTLLYDDELEQAARMIYDLYNVGVDAILVQDMGLLQCDLPPIELHASTQTHNATVERVKFLEQAGFRRVVLARETSLEQMRAIREQTNVELEAFVQGALCVSYSGQCYMSEYLTHRSGNRGCCTQPCRSSYDLLNADGRLLQQNEHLLSLKDFSAAQHIESMADAGIVSFKIEGRLKDMGYVKNLTAFYRQLFDNMMERRSEYRPLSSGRCRFFFVPDLQKTFNRGFTDYFLCDRQPMASFHTQKSIGKQVGRVVAVQRETFTVESDERFTAGDGLCYYADGEMKGFLVNRVNGNVLFPNSMPQIKVGTELWRNNDFAFEKMLQGRSAVREIGVSAMFSATEDGFTLRLTDDDGFQYEASVDWAKEQAQNVLKSGDMIVRQLSKLGDTVYSMRDFTDATQGAYFIPVAVLNQLRRDAVAGLDVARRASAVPQPTRRIDTGCGRVGENLDYSYNVVNSKAEAFYREHGAVSVEPGLEVSQQFGNKALMTTKYCLRYELGQCLRCKNNKKVSDEYRGELYLRNNKRLFRLEFDCQNCMMRIFKAE